jgi:hypothetical protein
MRCQDGDIVVGLLGLGIKNVILLQGREPFGFIGWQWCFHISMDFNAKKTATGAVRARTASQFGIKAGRSRRVIK